MCETAAKSTILQEEPEYVESYRNFFKDGGYKAAYTLYVMALMPMKEATKGNFDISTLAELASSSGISPQDMFQQEVVINSSSILELIYKLEQVLDGLSWGHGDIMRKKYVYGETIRTEIATRAMNNTLKAIEKSDIYDFQGEGVECIQYINNLMIISEQEEECERAMKIAKIFKRKGFTDFTDSFFEFREKFHGDTQVVEEPVEIHEEETPNHLFRIVGEQNEGNETYIYRLYKDGSLTKTKKRPVFTFQPSLYPGIEHFKIVRVKIGNCPRFGTLLVPEEIEKDGRTIFYAEEPNEKCIKYVLLEDGRPVREALRPVFMKKRRPNATYRIRVEMENDEVEFQMMLAKDLMGIERKSKLERKITEGNIALTNIYFVQQAMEAIKTTDKKLYEKIIAFNNSKKQSRIKNTFSLLSFLITSQTL